MIENIDHEEYKSLMGGMLTLDLSAKNDDNLNIKCQTCEENSRLKDFEWVDTIGKKDDRGEKAIYNVTEVVLKCPNCEKTNTYKKEEN